MAWSAQVGLRLSRSCARQHASLRGPPRRFQTSAPAVRGQSSQGKATGERRGAPRPPASCVRFPRVSSGRCFATKNPGYSVISGGSDDTQQLQRRKLVLYSKPGCCLCDALKEKLHLAFLLGGDHDLSDVELEVRDITANEEWRRSYEYEIPVLARLRGDNSEVAIPRFSPRLAIEQLQKKLAVALDSET